MKRIVALLVFAACFMFTALPAWAGRMTAFDRYRQAVEKVNEADSGVLSMQILEMAPNDGADEGEPEWTLLNAMAYTLTYERTTGGIGLDFVLEMTNFYSDTSFFGFGDSEYLPIEGMTIYYKSGIAYYDLGWMRSAVPVDMAEIGDLLVGSYLADAGVSKDAVKKQSVKALPQSGGYELTLQLDAAAFPGLDAAGDVYITALVDRQNKLMSYTLSFSTPFLGIFWDGDGEEILSAVPSTVGATTFEISVTIDQLGDVALVFPDDLDTYVLLDSDFIEALEGAKDWDWDNLDDAELDDLLNDLLGRRSTWLPTFS